MIKGEVVGTLIAPVQLESSSNGMPAAVLPVLTDVGGGSWELVSIVVRQHDLAALPLQTWIRAEGELRLARWLDKDGMRSQLAMRARRVEILSLPDRRRIVDRPPNDEPVLRSFREQMN